MPITYNIYRNGNLLAEGIEGNSYTDTNAEPSTDYAYQVSAVNENGESELSESVTVTTGYSAVDSVSVSPKTNNLDVGGTRQLKVNVSPDTADQSVSWETSDSSIVAVDNNGLIEAVSAGSAQIKATAGDITDEVTVNVTEPEPELEEENGNEEDE